MWHVGINDGMALGTPNNRLWYELLQPRRIYTRTAPDDGTTHISPPNGEGTLFAPN